MVTSKFFPVNIINWIIFSQFLVQRNITYVTYLLLCCVCLIHPNYRNNVLGYSKTIFLDLDRTPKAPLTAHSLVNFIAFFPLVILRTVLTLWVFSIPLFFTRQVNKISIQRLLLLLGNTLPISYIISCHHATFFS